MKPIPQDAPEDKLEYRINVAHPVYQGLKLLRRRLSQLGFHGHENLIGVNFLFTCDGSRDHEFYRTNRRMTRGIIKGLHGISVSIKDYEKCIDRIKGLIESAGLTHGSN
jgi:hypothetical protein